MHVAGKERRKRGEKIGRWQEKAWEKREEERWEGGREGGRREAGGQQVGRKVGCGGSWLQSQDLKSRNRRIVVNLRPSCAAQWIPFQLVWTTEYTEQETLSQKQENKIKGRGRTGRRQDQIWIEKRWPSLRSATLFLNRIEICMHAHKATSLRQSIDEKRCRNWVQYISFNVSTVLAPSRISQTGPYVLIIS